MTAPAGPSPGAPPIARVPAGRLLATLGGAGAFAGALLVFVYQTTQPAIRAHKALVLQRAIAEVLKEPARYDTLYVYGNALTATLPEGTNPGGLQRVYAGYASSGARVGFAITAGEPGFQDVVHLIFGYDPASGRLLGMKVLENKETPGLGDRIEKDTAFVARFDGALPPLLGVKAGTGGADPAKIDMITGATISSRTVIKAINNALARLQPMLEAYPVAAR